ncbi:MAG: triosephosphate isomerase [Candidatus Levybacteria bacterium]|nr:triosephosphate isomerase [Candidatus Levybacteria bacterium]
MKKLFIVANWKSNKGTFEALEWLNKMALYRDIIISKNINIILCPTFIFLPIIKDRINQLQLPINLGAQSISPFSSGKFTGEVNAGQLKEFADYVIVGHSERRQLGETDEMIFQQIELAKKNNINSIYCVPEVVNIPRSVDIVAYEPPSSISPGEADTPENAEKIIKSIKIESGTHNAIYGGNVTSGNINSFTSMANIDGALVGRASLDPLEFGRLIENA